MAPKNSFTKFFIAKVLVFIFAALIYLQIPEMMGLGMKILTIIFMISAAIWTLVTFNVFFMYFGMTKLAFHISKQLPTSQSISQIATPEDLARVQDATVKLTPPTANVAVRRAADIIGLLATVTLGGVLIYRGFLSQGVLVGYASGVSWIIRYLQKSTLIILDHIKGMIASLPEKRS